MSYSIELVRPGQAVIRDALGNDHVGIGGGDAERIYIMAEKLQEADPSGCRANDFLSGFVLGADWIRKITGLNDE